MRPSRCASATKGGEASILSTSQGSADSFEPQSGARLGVTAGRISSDRSDQTGAGLAVDEWTTTWRSRRRGWVVRRMLLVADTLGIACAIGLAALTDHYAPWLLLSWPLLVVLGKVNGLYGGDEERAHHTTIDDVEGVFNTFTTGAFLLLVLSLLVGDAIDSKELVIFWAFSVSLVLCLRFVARGITRRTTAYQQNTIIVGAGRRRPAHRPQAAPAPRVRHQPRRLRRRRPEGTPGRARRPDAARRRPTSLPELVAALDVERVVVAFSSEPHADTLRSDPRAARPRRPGRHRAAPVRGRRAAGARPHASRGCRSSGCRRCGSARTSRLVKRWPRRRRRAPAAGARRCRCFVYIAMRGSGATRRARSSSGRRGSG